MSYIGYPQPPRALTSADIDEGAVTLADISFTDTPSNLNLNGNYNDQTMRLAHNTTVTGDVTLNNSKDFTVSSSSGLLVSSASHNLSNDDQIYVQTSATLPTGLSANTNYYVISKTDDTFKLSTTRGGSAIAYTNAGSGTHTWYKNVNLILAKVADDGNPVTLTNDGSTRTLSGIGSIETSTLSSRPNSLVTGMTGELGSGVTGGSGLSLTGMTGTIGDAVTGSPALNLGSTTFPAGHIVGSQWFLDTSGDYANTTTTQKAVRDFSQITVTSGNTIILGFSGWVISTNSGGQNENKRVSQWYIRYHTSAVTEGTDTASTGTIVFTSKVGAEDTNDTSARPRFNAVHGTGAFVASASTYYVGASMSSIHTTITSTVKMSGSEPYYFYYYELQGDVLS